jgi:hypothetical protein
VQKMDIMCSVVLELDVSGVTDGEVESESSAC